MISWSEMRIEKAIKEHDSMLFLNRNYLGELQIMRKSFISVPYDLNGITLNVQTPSPHYIMSLTEDWTGRTRPVDWGLEPIMRRLGEIDNWGGESVYERTLKDNERIETRKKNSFTSLTEDVAREWQKDFKKHTKDILTHSVDKKDPRSKGDRKYGNC